MKNGTCVYGKEFIKHCGFALNVSFTRKLIVTSQSINSYVVGHIKCYVMDKSRLFLLGHAIANSDIPVREKLVGSFSDRIDVPNGPFFINERMNQRCRAGRKFRICMAMQFARSLGDAKVGRAKSGEKTRRKRTRTSALAVEKGRKKEDVALHEERLAIHFHSKRAMPRNFQSGRKGNT